MRIIITPKEFANLTGYSIPHAQKLFTKLRKALGKKARAIITKEEASQFFDVKIP